VVERRSRGRALTSKRGRGGEVRCLLHEAIVELWRRRSGVVVTGIRGRGRESLRLWCSRRRDWQRLLVLGLGCAGRRWLIRGGAGRVKLVRIGTLGIGLLLSGLLLLVVLGGMLLVLLLVLLHLLRGKRARVERGLVF